MVPRLDEDHTETKRISTQAGEQIETAARQRSTITQSGWISPRVGERIETGTPGRARDIAETPWNSPRVGEWMGT